MERKDPLKHIQTPLINLTKELLSALRSVVWCWENGILELVQRRKIFKVLDNLLNKDDDLGHLIMSYSWPYLLSDLKWVVKWLIKRAAIPVCRSRTSTKHLTIFLSSLSSLKNTFALGFWEPFHCWQKCYMFLKETAHSNGYNVWWYIKI